MNSHLAIDNPNIDFVELVTSQVQLPDARLLALLLKNAPLTAEEWAYLEAIEERAS